MTNERTDPGISASDHADDAVVVAAQVADDAGTLAEGAVAAQGDQALIVARFADPTPRGPYTSRDTTRGNEE